MTGRFIVIDGPNGAGKTTIAAHLAARLQEHSTAVHLTAEPTGTALGQFIRSAEAYLTGRALGLAVAADRYAHIEHEIIPALQSGQDVISHRYVPSSLVLQRLDGLTLPEIWGWNCHVIVPDLSVYLEDDQAVIASRLRERPDLSRLERQGSPARELDLYEDAFRFLARRGWPQIRIDCRGLSPGQITARILSRIGPAPEQKRA